LTAKQKAEEEAASLALGRPVAAGAGNRGGGSGGGVVAPEPAPAPAPAAATAAQAQAAAQYGAAAGGRVVVRDAAALRAAVVDKGGAPVVELDPAGDVFALGTESLKIRRPVRLVSGAGGRATLAGGEGGEGVLVRVYSPGVALEGLALVAGTDDDGG
jgi:hypothetical protein